MSETVASGGKYWNFSKADTPSKQPVNVWVYLFLIMAPFIAMLTLVFTGFIVFSPFDMVYPESIAGGWVNPKPADDSTKIVGGALIGLFTIGVLGGILISRFCQASAMLIIFALFIIGPVIAGGTFALGAQAMRPFIPESKVSADHPTFKEWAKNTYGYEVKSSIEEKGKYEVLQVVNASGADLTVKLFRDGDNTYLYEDTFQLNDTLTKINAEKQAKKADTK